MTCIDAFKNLNIQIIDESLAISPCCISPTVITDKINFQANPYLQQIRTEWLSNKYPKECSSCSKFEQQGMPSRRQGSNQWYTDNNHFNTNVELIRLDYWTGDICNLRCVICGPHNSSAWKEELKIPLIERKVNVNKFWIDLDLSSIKYIHFNGGEPLLSKEHILFLKDIPIKENVIITYNSNATILPSLELLELWEQFKLVQIDFSIDDIGDRFEYQRFPAKWEKVTDNLNWFIKNSPVNCMFATNTSIGILNHNNIENLNRWLQENFYVNRVTDPIEHRQQFVAGLFALDTFKENVQDIISTLDSIDQRRGTNWKITFPELIEKLS